MSFTVRTLTEDELLPHARLTVAAFMLDTPEERIGRWTGLHEPDRTHGVFEDGALLGAAGVQTRHLTLPGTGPRPFAAVTTVVVDPGHRRRGVLRRLMTEQLTALHDGGEPVAALWASEAAIYGRFGYAMASEVVRLEIPQRAAFRPRVDIGTDRVRLVARDEALPLVKDLYERVRPTRTGWISRNDVQWAYFLSDDEWDRHGQSAYRYALHPDGYVVYRLKADWQDRGPRGELHVREFVAATPEATAALYRHVLDADLIGEIKYSVAATDDPIVHLLADSRLIRRRRSDSLWVRIVDVDRALASRTYSSDVDLVLEVADDLCPWNTDRWRLTVRDGVAEVTRTPDEADVVLDVRALGSAFLGGQRLTSLTGAQLVAEVTPGSLRALSSAFLGDHDPHCHEIF
ncbi:GNAT family N-acetyltransferase [Saccharothrix violaceirubra]|uniref:Putative acetyltransferase n=1 Tax=Saccharothrix violaceirubra TaxID=413306 RepID=A0A7W7WY24_9PSEU|nr:GNAT family N-acetyltransferase [Saccharothrix violaceirubra]MBB4967970.1 putative acetyltransferase [Saccharothrix violaceirubra]